LSSVRSDSLRLIGAADNLGIFPVPLMLTSYFQS
jgi:hypothetical protein